MNKNEKAIACRPDASCLYDLCACLNPSWRFCNQNVVSGSTSRTQEQCSAFSVLCILCRRSAVWAEHLVLWVLLFQPLDGVLDLLYLGVFCHIHANTWGERDTFSKMTWSETSSWTHHCKLLVAFFGLLVVDASDGWEQHNLTQNDTPPLSPVLGENKGREHWHQIQICSILPKSCCIVLCTSHNKNKWRVKIFFTLQKSLLS